MKIGFTGTRNGMTSQQKDWIEDYLTDQQSIEEAIHGGCIGADIQFDELFVGSSTTVYVWPSNIKSMQGKWSNLDIVRPEQPPLIRNKIIVDLANVMIAAPKGFQEELRSGTWATIRYARQQYIRQPGKHLIIVWPDGSVLGEVTGHMGCKR